MGIVSLVPLLIRVKRDLQVLDAKLKTFKTNSEIKKIKKPAIAD